MSGDSSSGEIRRLPVVGVLGGGGEPLDERVAELCRELGERLARRGCHLLTGGGRGVMTEVARAYVTVEGRDGLSIGLLPGDAETGEPPAGYPNPFVELPVRTHLPARGERGESRASRNHLNVMTADALIALPGGAGTASEVRLALRYRRPIVAFGRESTDPILPPELPRFAEWAELERWLDSVLATLERRGGQGST